MHLYGNNGYANSPQWYVLRTLTLSVLFITGKGYVYCAEQGGLIQEQVAFHV